MSRTFELLNHHVETVDTAALGSGMQHDVGIVNQIDQTDVTAFNNQVVAKWPNFKGKIWDKLTFDCAKKDQSILKQHGVPHPTTVIKEGITVSVEGRWNPKVLRPNYVLFQEKLQGECVEEDDLKTYEPIRNQVRDMYSISVELAKSKQGSLDITGFGTATSLFHQAIGRQVRWGIHNLYKNNEDNIVLIDTLLLDPKRVPFVFKDLVLFLGQIQHAAIHRVLSESLDPQNLPHPNVSNSMMKLADFLVRYRDKGKLRAK